MFSADVLTIDPGPVADEIADSIGDRCSATCAAAAPWSAISGGIDSSVVAALCVARPRPRRVLGALHARARLRRATRRASAARLAEQLGIEAVVEDIGPALDGLGCYERQIEAIRMVFPEYGDGWKCKITLPSHPRRRSPERVRS